MDADIQRVLLDRATIARRVEQLAAQIAADFALPDASDAADVAAAAADPPGLTLVPVLTGSFIFTADLIRHLPLRLRIGLISVSSYPGRSTASQGVSIQEALTHLPATLEGGRVLIVDDILDSGRTLGAVRDALAARRPALLRTCVLLRKQRPEALAFPVDYVGFDIPDEFVVGYGLDFNGYYRNLPQVVTLRPSVLRD